MNQHPQRIFGTPRRTLSSLLLVVCIFAVVFYLYNNNKNEALSGRKTKSSILSRKRHKINIICFGDSLTEGSTVLNGDFYFHPYSNKLQKLLNHNYGNISKRAKEKSIYKVYNEGISGERVIGEMTSRLPRILKKHSRSPTYNWVIILGGTNDLRVAERSGNYEMKHRIFEAIVSLHRVSHRYGAKTVVVTIPARKCELRAKCLKVKLARLYINKYLRDYAKQLGVKKVVVTDLARKMPVQKMMKYWADEVHFTPDGYDKMAVIIHETLKEYL